MASLALDAIGARQRAKIKAKQQSRAARQRFKRVHLAEKSFARQLRAIAKRVSDIVKSFAPSGVVSNPSALNRSLMKYSSIIKPWAERVAQKSVSEIVRRDDHAWATMGEEIGRSLRSEIKSAPTGGLTRSMVNQRVDLIQSLSTKAAQRVHKLVLEGMSRGARTDHLKREIMKTGRVTRARAELIAQTETTSAATALVEARSKFIGSEGYFWRTANDADVRQEHKKLDGKFIRWDSPPLAGPNGQRYHAGAGPRCRCWPDPVIPDA